MRDEERGIIELSTLGGRFVASAGYLGLYPAAARSHGARIGITRMRVRMHTPLDIAYVHLTSDKSVIFIYNGIMPPRSHNVQLSCECMGLLEGSETYSIIKLR
jgi:hypothetical protein